MECEGESEASAKKKKKYPPTEDELDRLATEQWIMWQEPSCDTILCKRQYAPCTCSLGKFPTDDYPAFLASRGIDAKEFAADIAAVTEHVRRAIAASFRLKDKRGTPLVLGLVAVIAWAAGASGPVAFGIGFGTMAVCYVSVECWHWVRKFIPALEEEVQRLLPKYEKIGVTICQKQVATQGAGADGGGGEDYYYLVFEVMQTDVEAPPDATSAGEVVVAGEIVRS
jgi:hypothetical protein